MGLKQPTRMEAAFEAANFIEAICMAHGVHHSDEERIEFFKTVLRYMELEKPEET